MSCHYLPSRDTLHIGPAALERSVLRHHSVLACTFCVRSRLSPTSARRIRNERPSLYVGHQRTARFFLQSQVEPKCTRHCIQSFARRRSCASGGMVLAASYHYGKFKIPTGLVGLATSLLARKPDTGSFESTFRIALPARAKLPQASDVRETAL